MAGEISTQIIFADQQQITSSILNAIIATASFTANAVVGSTLTVVNGKLKVGTLTSSELGPACVSTSALQDLSVTTQKIGVGQVQNVNYAGQSITGDKIALNTIAFNTINGNAIAGSNKMVEKSGFHLVTPNNVRYSQNAIKAGGCILCTSNSRVIFENEGIQSVVRIGPTVTRVILSSPMASSTYVVVCTPSNTSSSSVAESPCTIYQKSPQQFNINHPVESAGLQLNFLVFGLLG
jgi:hypothetical protein